MEFNIKGRKKVEKVESLRQNSTENRNSGFLSVPRDSLCILSNAGPGLCLKAVFENFGMPHFADRRSLFSLCNCLEVAAKNFGTC